MAETANAVKIQEEEMLPEEGNMSLLEHLTELRTRLMYIVAAWIVLVIVCFFFSEYIINFLLEPFVDVVSKDPVFKDVNVEIQATALHEILFTQVKAAAFVGTIIVSPFLLAQIWGFISPGLYKQERKAFWPFLAATPILFLMGAALVYYVLMPFAWKFFLGMQQLGQPGAIDIKIQPKISEYFSLVMRLMLAFGFCFQLPVGATLMGKVGLITAASMRRVRKYAILCVFVVGAVLTPPDPISQLSLALPIILLYEVSIYLVSLIEKKREDEEYYDDEDFYDDEDEDELEDQTSK